MPTLIFDVDNTLTPPREQISQEMANLFIAICNQNTVWLTTGSDSTSIRKQLGSLVSLPNRIFTNYCVESGFTPHPQSVYDYFSEYSYSISAHKLTLTTVSDIATRQSMVRQFKTDWPQLEFYVSGRRSIDILPAGVSKHTFLGILSDTYTYFGDEFHEFGNDTTILAYQHNVLVHRVSNWQETYSKLQEFL